METYSAITEDVIHRLQEVPRIVAQLLENLQQSYNNINVKETVNTVLQPIHETFGNPKVTILRLKQEFRILFRDDSFRKGAIIFTLGAGSGLILGYYLFRSPRFPVRLMKCVASISYDEADNVTLIRKPRPQTPGPHEVLIRVQAVALDRIDGRISKGHGRFLRNIIQRTNIYTKPEFPLLLGRSCAGVVEAVGKRVKTGLEVGDEVWAAATIWEPGLACEYITVHENSCGKKPFIIGFEGASSLPYSGHCAFHALKDLNKNKVCGKKILIEDGCSSVGVVLIQILKRWGAQVTASVYFRSEPVVKALGADNVIIYGNEKIGELVRADSKNAEQVNFINELNFELYDYIFLTRTLNYDCQFLKKFLISPESLIINCVEPPTYELESPVMRAFYTIYVKMKLLWAEWRGRPLLLDGHILIQQESINRLADYVNDGILQTVIDQVFTAEADHCERAMQHVNENKRIGSTVITFR